MVQNQEAQVLDSNNTIIERRFHPDDYSDDFYDNGFDNDDSDDGSDDDDADDNDSE